MKCFHTIDGSLSYCLRGNGGSDAPSPISAASSGGLEEGRLGVGGSLGAPNPSGAHSSNKKNSTNKKSKFPQQCQIKFFLLNTMSNSSLSINEFHNQIQ